MSNTWIKSCKFALEIRLELICYLCLKELYNMTRRTIRINETGLRNMVKYTIRTILEEDKTKVNNNLTFGEYKKDMKKSDSMLRNCQEARHGCSNY